MLQGQSKKAVVTFDDEIVPDLSDPSVEFSGAWCIDNTPYIPFNKTGSTGVLEVDINLNQATIPLPGNLSETLPAGELYLEMKLAVTDASYPDGKKTDKFRERIDSVTISNI